MMRELIQRIYYRSPETVQDFLFSCYGFYLRKQRFNKAYFTQFDQLVRSEWYTEQQIQDYQQEKLKQTLETAFRYSDFYKFWFAEHGVNIKEIKTPADLPLLPVSSKSLIRNSQKDYCNKSIPASRLIKGLTSGTSGQAFTVYNTSDTLAFQWAIWGRHKNRFNIHVPEDKYLMFGARVPIDVNSSTSRFYRKDWGLNRHYLSTYHLKESNFPAIIDYLNANKFEYYTGYPSNMYVLAKYMLDHNIPLLNKPKYVITGSDALYKHYEDIITRAWGVPVTEQYGMAEACGNVSKCEHGRFHLDFEMGYLELEDIPETPSSPYKKMLFTGLSNYAMPLIRYDIGDLAIPSKDPCPCGRKSITLQEISGREEDYIVTPDGRHLQGFNQVFEWANGVDLIQVYQDVQEAIEVRYIPGKTFSNHDIQLLEKEFRKRLGKEILIDYKAVKEVEYSKSGKYKAVISKIPRS